MKPLNERTSAAMAKVKTRKTEPEERVAACLRRLGISYRRNVKTLPGKPDFANKAKGWAVQVHGCFWHGHDCKRGTIPVHNRDSWVEKISKNRRRDSDVERQLVGLGLKVHTIWECETKDSDGLISRLDDYLG